MSQLIKNPHTTAGADCANKGVAQHHIALIKKRFAGVETVDPQQVAEELARLIEPISRREHKCAEAEREQLRAKHPAQDPVAGALHALRKLLASGGQ